MNNLHLQYLRETGNRAIKGDWAYALWSEDIIPDEHYDKLKDWLYEQHLEDISDPKYVEWLESKLNSL